MPLEPLIGLRDFWYPFPLHKTMRYISQRASSIDRQVEEDLANDEDEDHRCLLHCCQRRSTMLSACALLDSSPLLPLLNKVPSSAGSSKRNARVSDPMWHPSSSRMVWQAELLCLFRGESPFARDSCWYGPGRQA